MQAPSAPLVLPFTAIGAADLPRVGGKGANLGELAAAGFPVPTGFCVTTTAFDQHMAGVEGADALLDALETLSHEDLERARALGAQLRAAVTATPLPEAIRASTVAAWQQAGADHAYAVRSSATAEDLPGASFAGQQDTYLNVRGEDALLDAIRACMASLFTDRAILYRARQGFSHRQVSLSVVVQRMVESRISGILFTADPLSGHRGVASIDASWGLGEALVSGVISADNYRVDKASLAVLDARIGDKEFLLQSTPEGGTERVDLPPARRKERVCDDAMLGELVALGARIEAHYKSPQDIEWCLDDEGLKVVQSRPITSLFPVPTPAPTDGLLHAYMSFGHLQVMTDPISPMGRSIWRRMAPFGRTRDQAIESPWVAEAGGRVYMDASPMLLRGPTRAILRRILSNAEALMGRAVEELLRRPDFLRGASQLALSPGGAAPLLLPVLRRVVTNLVWADPVALAGRFPAELDAEVAAAHARLRTGAPLVDRLALVRVLLADLPWKVFTKLPVAMAGILSEGLLTGLLRGRAAPEDVAALGRGMEGNITTAMDLEVGDLADVARAAPAVAEALAAGERDLDALAALDGGAAFTEALAAFLERFGARGTGEIDVGRVRMKDDPSLVLQVVAGNLSRPAGAHRTHHAEQVRQAREALPRLVQAAGWLRRPLVKRLLRVCRNVMPLREHPKFMFIRILEEIRQLLLEAGAELVARDALDHPRDVFLLTLTEVEDALRSTPSTLRETVEQRRAEQARFAEMSPPRVLTSEGESIVGRHSTEGLPPGALAGSGASAGVVEGVARVVRDPTREVLHAGEILVAPFTDPGWTPLFINAAGLVMEVGGMMTHGSVVAREYGIPAVVCVPGAMTKIKTGDRLRVDGDRGFVEILGEAS
ncbi:MAG: phosphoenolpyruvate synthase [Alphaproteobacteria bacterium]|nr:phosphoenolpyruvate synthase [Alphaproteobacteria bacterium]